MLGWLRSLRDWFYKKNAIFIVDHYLFNLSKKSKDYCTDEGVYLSDKKHALKTGTYFYASEIIADTPVWSKWKVVDENSHKRVLCCVDMYIQNGNPRPTANETSMSSLMKDLLRREKFDKRYAVCVNSKKFTKEFWE